MVPRSSQPEQRLVGTPVSPGVAIGSIAPEVTNVHEPECYAITEEMIPQELVRLHAAMERTAHQITEIKDKIAAMSGEKEAAIFDAHIMLLRDKQVRMQIEKGLQTRLHNVEYVTYAVIENYKEAFKRVDDAYLRAKISDIEDVLNRLLANLRFLSGGAEEAPKKTILPANAILVAYDLTPSDTVALDVNKVMGFATEMGSNVSHTAIIARSMGIPAVVGLEGAVIKVQGHQPAILDGYTGVLILHPTAETIARYRQIIAHKKEIFSELERLKEKPTVTLDNHHVTLATNVEFSYEYSSIMEVNACGVGLFRTEFFLLGNGMAIPGEDHQAAHYAELVRGCAPHEVIFRTLDAGGDKLPCEELAQPEPNPFLGWRGIRVSLSRQDMFKDQLRAILRSSAFGKVGIMFPMVSGLTEVHQARALLDECKAELRGKGVHFDEKIKVGIMIEVPSAAVMADVLAPHVDFFSIGTNDLVQYTIAVDRVNSRVAHMFRPTHPGVIRMIDMTVRAGNKVGIPTAVCGEMAADINLIPLLIGLGVRELSVGVHLVQVVRYAIRHLDFAKCQAMAELALAAPDSYVIADMTKKLAQESYPFLFE